MKSVPRAAPPPPIPPARYERSNSATLAPLPRTGGSRRRRLGCFFREGLQSRGRPVQPLLFPPCRRSALTRNLQPPQLFQARPACPPCPSGRLSWLSSPP